MTNTSLDQLIRRGESIFIKSTRGTTILCEGASSVKGMKIDIRLLVDQDGEQDVAAAETSENGDIQS